MVRFTDWPVNMNRSEKPSMENHNTHWNILFRKVNTVVSAEDQIFSSVFLWTWGPLRRWFHRFQQLGSHLLRLRGWWAYVVPQKRPAGCCASSGCLSDAGCCCEWRAGGQDETCCHGNCAPVHLGKLSIRFWETVTEIRMRRNSGEENNGGNSLFYLSSRVRRRLPW